MVLATALAARIYVVLRILVRFVRDDAFRHWHAVLLHLVDHLPHIFHDEDRAATVATLAAAGPSILQSTKVLRRLLNLGSDSLLGYVTCKGGDPTTRSPWTTFDTGFQHDAYCLFHATCRVR